MPSDPRSDDRPHVYAISEDVDMLVVGAGITGIYQLYRAREAGWSVQLLEAGSGVGGTWYWNRYPGARFDSESYTYAYIFSKELFDEWVWPERFAAQPDTERYLNHVVDRFDLRGHMRFNAQVAAAVYDESSGTWLVTTDDGSVFRTRYLVAATGNLSVPVYPDVPGCDEFAGEAYHTGRWPKTPVDFAGKRVAVVGTGSSGVQIMPVIVDDAASVTVYQRTANWCTPLNNAPIMPDEQAYLRKNFESIRETLQTSPGGFLHVAHDRRTFDDTEEERQAFYEKMWNSPGFSKYGGNYTDILFDRQANALWCEFLANKIRSIVHDPTTAEMLIPKTLRWSEKRPPFVIGYYEAFNNPKVSLVDLPSTPMVRVTETGIETTEGGREFDIIVWATGFDYGTGAILRMGIRGRNGRALTDAWSDGPKTYLGLQTPGFPNLFFPGGPHAAAGNNPRYNGDQVDFITEVIAYAKSHDADIVELDEQVAATWTDMIDRSAKQSPFGESSHYFGTNIAGKPRKYLLNTSGRLGMFKEFDLQRETGYAAFTRSQSESRANRPHPGAATEAP